MTPAREIAEQAAVDARESEWERDRRAWNLPPRPVEPDSPASEGSPEPLDDTEAPRTLGRLEPELKSAPR